MPNTRGRCSRKAVRASAVMGCNQVRPVAFVICDSFLLAARPASGMRGGLLLRQLGPEGLLSLRDIFGVALGIDERVRGTGLQLRALGEHAEVFAVGAEEDIAGQGFQDGKAPRVVVGD